MSLGLLVYFKSNKSQTGKNFARFALTAALWSFSYFIWQISKDRESALFWCKILTFFATFLPLTQLIFINDLLKIKQSPVFTVFIYTFSFIGATLSFSHYLVADVAPIAGFQFWPKAGLVYGWYLTIWIILILFGLFLLIYYRMKSSGALRTFLTYLIIAKVIGYIGGMSNYPLWFGVELLPYGNIFITFYVIIFSYAITRQRVLNIRIIKTESLLFLIFAILLIDAIAFTSWQETIVRFALIGLFVFVAFKFVKTLLEFERANQRLEMDKVELTSLDKMKDEFIQMATHELNTPITTIRGRLDMCVRENMCQLTDEQRQVLAPILEQTARLARLSANILSASQITRKQLRLNVKPVNLHLLLNYIVSQARAKARARGNSIIFQPLHTVSSIPIDQDKISNVLTGLIDNANRFTQDGNIVVSVAVRDNLAIISVADSGVGIDEEDQKHIFKKFHQVDRFAVNGPQEQQGQGLGLYIARNVVRLHGGEMWFTSQKGRGSTFYLSLPLSKE